MLEKAVAHHFVRNRMVMTAQLRQEQIENHPNTGGFWSFVMSELGSDAPGSVDSKNVGQMNPFDVFYLDFADDLNALPEEWPVLEKESRSVTSRPRVPYGKGPDAQRTAKYRCYPIRESPVIRQLLHHPGAVSKRWMMQLIDICLASSPPGKRPTPPTRSQKRAKGGLVSWIDENAGFVMHYVRWSNCFK
jgi:hypothetical protein